MRVGCDGRKGRRNEGESEDGGDGRRQRVAGRRWQVAGCRSLLRLVKVPKNEPTNFRVAKSANRTPSAAAAALTYVTLGVAVDSAFSFLYHVIQKSLGRVGGRKVEKSEANPPTRGARRNWGKGSSPCVSPKRVSK